MKTTLTIKNRLTLETSDEATYYMFGLDGEYKEMILTKKDIDCLESYLYDLEDEEDERVDEDTWKVFNTIKEYLKEYKEVQVVYKENKQCLD